MFTHLLDFVFEAIETVDEVSINVTYQKGGIDFYRILPNFCTTFLKLIEYGLLFSCL